MPPETPKLTQHEPDSFGHYVRIGKRICWKRDRHTLMSFVVSCFGCLMATTGTLGWGFYLYALCFGKDAAQILTLLSVPYWGLYIFTNVPDIYLLEWLDE